MRRIWAPVFAMSWMCSSCIIFGPHYRLDATTPFLTERSGRIMKATPSLAELPEDAWHDQLESLLALDPLRFVWTPICTVWIGVSTLAYDVVCLPRDIYLRNFAGLEVFVFDADGTPIEDVVIRASEIIGGRRLADLSSEFRTSNDGRAYIPRKADHVRISDVEIPVGNTRHSVVPFTNVSFDDADRSETRPSIMVMAVKEGVSYAPVEIDIVKKLNFERGMRLTLDLSTGRDSPPSDIPFSFAFSQPNWRQTVRFEICSNTFPAFSVESCSIPAQTPLSDVRASLVSEGWRQGFSLEGPFPSPVSIKEDKVDRERWIARRTAYLKEHPDNPDRSLQWEGRFRNRIRTGLEAEQWVLFKIGDHYGVLTDCFLEYGDGVYEPTLHLHWFFNIEPDKDWFDMDGVPVKAFQALRSDE